MGLFTPKLLQTLCARVILSSLSYGILRRATHLKQSPASENI